MLFVDTFVSIIPFLGYQKTLAYFLCFPEKFIKLPDSDVNDDIDYPY